MIIAFSEQVLHGKTMQLVTILYALHLKLDDIYCINKTSQFPEMKEFFYPRLAVCHK